MESKKLSVLDYSGRSGVILAFVCLLVWPSFAEDIETFKVALQYIQPSEAASMLNPLKSDGGTILMDDNENRLILMDTIDHIQLMQKRLETIDVPSKEAVNSKTLEDIATQIDEAISTAAGKFNFKNSYRSSVSSLNTPDMKGVWDILEDRIPKITIDTKIVQIVLEPEHHRGVDWSAIVSNSHLLDLTGVLPCRQKAISVRARMNGFPGEVSPGRLEEPRWVEPCPSGHGAPQSADAQYRKLTLGTISPEDYNVLLEALDSVGKTKPIGHIETIVLNNHEAKIFLGDRINPLSDAQTELEINTSRNSAFPLDCMELSVIPVVANNVISLTINPQFKDPTRIVTNPNSVQTTLTIQNGMTVIIGGLIKKEEISVENKNSIWSNLPVFGSAFKNENKMTTRTEVAIFLTPRIINQKDRTVKNSAFNL